MGSAGSVLVLTRSQLPERWGVNDWVVSYRYGQGTGPVSGRAAGKVWRTQTALATTSV